MSADDLVVECPIARTPRVRQLEGMFDLAAAKRSRREWSVKIDLPDEWQIGVIVGPSGAGKTTLARHLFGDAMVKRFRWPRDRSVVDAFPARMGIKEIAQLLSAVGFSSPPSWLRPYRYLSTGEQFRVHLARILAQRPKLAVIDEYTSVVDRTVAQIASAAFAKTVRRRGGKVVLVCCHYDVLDWLEPDWIYQPHTGRMDAGRRRVRPPIHLVMRRVRRSAWELFRRHHYLSTSIHQSAACFVASWKGQPVAFCSCMAHCHPQAHNLWREHRTVCLPDYQGVGIGNAVSAWLGSLLRGLCRRFLSITSHPAMMRSRARSPDWVMRQAPTWKTKTFPRCGLSRGGSGSRRSGGTSRRLRATFEYVGPAMERDRAERIWST